MKKIYALSMLALSHACVSCVTAGSGGQALDANQEAARSEMKSGEIELSEYERRIAFDAYIVLRSESAVEKNVLMRAVDAEQGVSFGRWTNIDEVRDGDVGGLVELMENIARNKVTIDLDESMAGGGKIDPLYVGMPKTERKLFDARSAIEKCVTHFQAGWMPRRVVKKDAEYVLTCILPGMEDSGYLIFAASDEKVASISRAEFYQYDRIPAH